MKIELREVVLGTVKKDELSEDVIGSYYSDEIPRVGEIVQIWLPKRRIYSGCTAWSVLRVRYFIDEYEGKAAVVLLVAPDCMIKPPEGFIK